jgi:hypothetical protein
MATPGRGPLRLSEETQASAGVMQVPKNDILIVTGTTQIDTIPPPFGGFVYGLSIILIPKDGSVVLSAAGNIAVGITAVQNRSVHLTWSKSQQKWFINSGV